MSLASLLHHTRQRGPALIGAGLAVVLAAQLWTDVPIAAAIVLIGWGATLAMQARSREGNLLAALNLTVYASLGCLAMAAQTHAAATSLTGRLPTTMLIDHAAAIIMLVALIRDVFRRRFGAIVR